MTTNHEAIAIVQAARVKAIAAFPYLRRGLAALKLIPREGLGTMAVDAKCRVYYDPATVCEWGVALTAGVIVHELAHPMRLHFARAQALGVTPAQARAWNIGADAEINDGVLVGVCSTHGIKLPEGAITPASLGLADGLLAEEYFAAVQAEQPEQPEPPHNPSDEGDEGEPSDEGGEGQGEGEPSDGEGKGKSKSPIQQALDNAPDCGSGVDGIEREHDAPESGEGEGGECAEEGMTDAEVRALARALARDIEIHEQAQAQQGRGNAAGGWGRWAKQALSPAKVSWQQKLRATVRAALRQGAGAADYRFSKPSRRSTVSGGVILPSLYAPLPEVAVVVDTSGSMGDADLTRAMSEVAGILRASGREATLYSVDSAASAPIKVRSIADVRLMGGGGTDMRVGIKAAFAAKSKPSTVIVITDGDTEWPSTRYWGKATVVACLVRKPWHQPPSHVVTVEAF
jgi:predicted metal-dependent peptidase